MNFLLLMASYGICFGLMNEKAPVINRFLYRLPIQKDEAQDTNLFSRMFDCAYCTGFHAGWVVWCVGGLSHTLGMDLSLWGRGADLMLFAFASSVFCYSLDTLLQWLER